MGTPGGLLSAAAFSEEMRQLSEYLEREARTQKQKLVSDVRKTDSALAEVLEAGDADYDGKTLRITLKQGVPQEGLDRVKEAAKRAGIMFLGIIIET